MTDRLSAKTAPHLPSHVRRPSYDRTKIGVGQVHLGVGAFHRAHQAIYTEGAIEAAGGDWGVLGVSLRSPTAADQLEPQDGLFTVATRSGDGESYRLVGNLKSVVTAPANPRAAMAALTNPSVHVVTLTITEKGYGLDPASGELIAGSGDIAADLLQPSEPFSAIGYIAEALRRRRAAGVPPFSVVSCDNLPSNGDRMASALYQYAERIDPALARFIEAEVACPSTMVDRIVPAMTAPGLKGAEAALSLRDEAHVASEPFMQWVIEDRFSGPRPDWGAAGAIIVPDVAPFETAKLRLLNGAHSAIAYLGRLAGIDFVHEVMADEVLSSFVTTLMDDEVSPTLERPGGLSLDAYAEALRERFRNPALDHATAQIATDGSQKLPQRVLATIRDRRSMGAPFSRLAFVVAAWIVYASGRGPGGTVFDVQDPFASRLTAIGQQADGDIDALVAGFLNIGEIFGDLGTDETFAMAVIRQLSAIWTHGVVDAAALQPHD